MEQQNAGAPATRPTFLTVLCILSFIWQGIVAIFIILAMMLIGAVAVVANEGMEQLEGMEGVDMSEVNSTVETASNGMAWAGVVVGLICVIISFIGVLRMWKLKKSGFMLYAAAFAISAIMGFVDGTWTPFGLVFGGAFVAMYAMNLKHMK